MYQSLNMDLVKATAQRRDAQHAHHRTERGRGSPPLRRVRGPAAGALALLAQRLDAERARRILA